MTHRDQYQCVCVEMVEVFDELCLQLFDEVLTVLFVGVMGSAAVY